MKQLVRLAASLSVFLALASCGGKSIYSGFEKTESGAYMKFYVKNASGDLPRLGDGVTFEMSQYFNDSLLFSTVGDAPIDLVLEPASFVGDVSDALLMMRVGDSARAVVSADSVFIALIKMDAPEEFAGKPIYYDLKLLSIKPSEVIEAEKQRVADSLRTAEQAYLSTLKSDAKNLVTESGLIVLSQKGKGKKAQTGDYVDFDFVMMDMNGDTLIDSFGIEPVEMQLGLEEFICKGFEEALCMVPEKGSMSFVIPSSLGFDAEGFEGLIAPYTSLVVDLTMNEVMDKDAFEKKQQAREAEEEKERQRRLQIEQDLITRYIKDYGITETPTESGLYIVRQEEGEGALAVWGDNVAVHYILSNLNGDQIESSYDFGEPMRFTIGRGEMIAAIEEALMTMAPGAKVTLISPSELAFGEFEIDKELLPAYSPLVIELELVAIE